MPVEVPALADAVGIGGRDTVALLAAAFNAAANGVARDASGSVER